MTGPRANTRIFGVATVVYVALSLAGFYLMRVALDYHGVNDMLLQTIDSGVFEDRRGVTLKKAYTGTIYIDYPLSFLVAAFTPGAAGFDKGAQLEQFHFLTTLFSYIAVTLIECLRERNRGTSATYISIWAFFYQTIGGAVVIPLNILAHIWVTTRAGYYDKPRSLSVASSQSIVYAATFGYFLPTVAMYLPSIPFEVQQTLLAVWQPLPVLVRSFVSLLQNTVFSTSSNTGSRKPSNTKDADIKFVKRICLISFAASLLIHVGVMYVCLTSTDPEMSLVHSFGIENSIADFLPNPPRTMTLTECLHVIFKVDQWIIFASALLWCLFSAWELVVAGKTKVSLLFMGVLITSGAVVLGPGATLSLFWYWREDKMASSATDKQRKAL